MIILKKWELSNKNMECLPHLVLVYYCFVLLVHAVDAQDLEKTSRKRAFCGKRLTSILGQFCLEYPSRETEHPYRSKRQIISECCQNKCSLDYLLENYCQTVNTEALEAFKREDDSKEQTSPPTTTTQGALSRRYRQKNSLEMVQFLNHADGSSSQNDDLLKNHRKRRNCSCKKLLKFKKLRRERRLWKALVKKNFTSQEPQIGEVEDHERPFYVTFS